MGRNRLKETEGDLRDIESDIPGHIDDQYETGHGNTINRMLIGILLILMAIVVTFMVIIARNLRILEIFHYLKMRIGVE